MLESDEKPSPLENPFPTNSQLKIALVVLLIIIVSVLYWHFSQEEMTFQDYQQLATNELKNGNASIARKHFEHAKMLVDKNDSPSVIDNLEIDAAQALFQLGKWKKATSELQKAQNSVAFVDLSADAQIKATLLISIIDYRSNQSNLQKILSELDSVFRRFPSHKNAYKLLALKQSLLADLGRLKPYQEHKKLTSSLQSSLSLAQQLSEESFNIQDLMTDELAPLPFTIKELSTLSNSNEELNNKLLLGRINLLLAWLGEQSEFQQRISLAESTFKNITHIDGLAATEIVKGLHQIKQQQFPAAQHHIKQAISYYRTFGAQRDILHAEYLLAATEVAEIADKQQITVDEQSVVGTSELISSVTQNFFKKGEVFNGLKTNTLLAVLHSETNDFAVADRIFKEVLSGYAKYNYQLGLTNSIAGVIANQIRQQQWLQALNTLQTIKQEIRERTPLLLILQAIVQSQTSQIEDAIDSFERAKSQSGIRWRNAEQELLDRLKSDGSIDDNQIRQFNFVLALLAYQTQY